MSSSIHAGISGNISFQIAEDQDEVDVFLNIFFYQHLQLCSFRHNCVLFVTMWFILSQKCNVYFSYSWSFEADECNSTKQACPSSDFVTTCYE